MKSGLTLALLAADLWNHHLDLPVLHQGTVFLQCVDEALIVPELDEAEALGATVLGITRDLNA